MERKQFKIVFLSSQAYTEHMKGSKGKSRGLPIILRVREAKVSCIKEQFLGYKRKQCDIQAI